MDARTINLANANMLQVCNTIQNDLSGKELSQLKTILSIKFPEALEKVQKLKEVEGAEVLSPYNELKTILLNHLDLLTKDDMLHLNEVAELYWEDENIFQTIHAINEKIKRKFSSPEEIDYELRRIIWEEMGTLRKTTSKQNNNPTVGIRSLDTLSEIYEQHPQHREYIAAELKRLPEQIKLLAPEYCGSQGENSAMELSQFKLIVRGIKLN